MKIPVGIISAGIFLQLVSARRRPMRLCNEGGLILNDIKVTNMTHKISVTRKTGNLSFFMEVDWKVENKQETQFDGYLVHVQDSSFGWEKRSISPVHCPPGTLKLEEIHNGTMFCYEYKPCMVNTTLQCVCPTMCETTSQYCNGVMNYWLMQHGFIPLPKERTTLRFPVQFYKTYKVDVYPFYRNTVSLQQDKSIKLNDCPSLVEQGLKVSIQEANNMCCHLSNTFPRDIKTLNPIHDFKEGIVNMSVTWLAPLTPGYQSFQVSITKNHASQKKDPKMTQYTAVSNARNTTNTAICDISTSVYQATAYNLQSDTMYTLHIVSIYTGNTVKCPAGFCSATLEFKTPAIDLCDMATSYCDEHANCSYNTSDGTSPCTCWEGYQGNGVNNKTDITGTGCTNINVCNSPNSPCALKAVCTDHLPPSTGANCTCFVSYYGDGYKNGTGCTGKWVLIVQITLPLISILAVVVLVKVWIKLKGLRRKKLDEKWSQFVASNAKSCSESLDSRTDFELDTIPELEECLPTFEVKWELNRKSLEIGDILGRGNFGVVYEATYYDGMLDPIMVAVKMLKENSASDVIVADFLTEIGFMLNVGEHPNIVQVIGCCTTQKPVLLVTELLKYGDLLNFLLCSREPSKIEENPIYHVTEEKIHQMARDVALGMHFLEKSRIIHGDLATRNVLVGEDLVCKISDFGLANDVYRTGAILNRSEKCVPFKWISPERMMSGKVPITSRSDVWSFGNLLYEMVTLGCSPHPNVNPEDLLERLEQGYRMEKPSSCSNQMSVDF